MAGIQHHGEGAHHFGGRGFLAGCRRGLALAGLFRATGGLAVVCRLAVGVGNQLLQRVDRMLGIQVQNQPVLVAGGGLEREHLRCHGLFQVEDDAQGFGVELAHAHLAHEGIVGADLAQQLAHLRFHFQPFQVQDDPIGVVDEAGTEGDGLGQFEGDAGVFTRRPHPHGRDGAVVGAGCRGLGRSFQGRALDAAGVAGLGGGGTGRRSPGRGGPA